MIKVTAYPFSKKAIPVIRFLEKFNSDLSIDYVVSLSGLSLDGKDIGNVDNRGRLGRQVSLNIKAALDNTDALLVLPGSIDDFFHCDTINTIIIALSENKEVVNLCELGDKATDEIISAVGQKSFDELFTDYCIAEWMDKVGFFEKERIYETECPVIFIGGLEKTDDFEILLSLYKKFEDDGYRISAIGGERYCGLFGFHSLPFFINRNFPIDESGKIYALNKIICEIETKELPDVILIQVPDGMIRYSDEMPNGFGANAYLYSNAFLPSYFICGAMVDSCPPESIEQISADFEVKYGYPINMLHVSRTTIQPSVTASEHEFCYVHRSEDYLLKRIESMKKGCFVPVYDLTDETMLNEAYNLILEQFKGR